MTTQLAITMVETYAHMIGHCFPEWVVGFHDIRGLESCWCVAIEILDVDRVGIHLPDFFNSFRPQLCCICVANI